MPTLDELLLSDELPNGLHDAELDCLRIDWARAQLVFEARVDVGDDAEGVARYRRVRFVVDGLVDCAIEPARTLVDGPDALAIIEGTDAPPPGFAPTPPGCFFHSLFDTSRNRFIHFVARTATYELVSESAGAVTETFFAVPVADMARATAFYEAAFDASVTFASPAWTSLAIAGVRVALFADGALAGRSIGLHFAARDLRVPCGAVEAAGGRIVAAPAEAAPGLVLAQVADTEGNAITLRAD